MIDVDHAIDWWWLGFLIGYVLVGLVVFRVASGHVAWSGTLARRARDRCTHRFLAPLTPSWSFGMTVGLGWGICWLPLLGGWGLWRVARWAWWAWPFPVGNERKGLRLLREEHLRAREHELGIGSGSGEE